MSDERVKQLAFLVVDDSRVSILAVQQMLESLGAPGADSAMSAAEAEEKMAQKRYDVVFMDWRMKGKSGVALMEQCRGDRAYDAVAFVIVSAESEKRFIGEAMKSGATSYIVKPFKTDTLKEHLDKVMVWLEQRGRFGKAQAS